MKFDNLFADVFEEPFYVEAGWQPLDAANANAAPGSRIASVLSRRRIRTASMFFVVRVVDGAPARRSVPRREVQGAGQAAQALAAVNVEPEAGLVRRLRRIFGRLLG